MQIYYEKRNVFKTKIENWFAFFLDKQILNKQMQYKVLNLIELEGYPLLFL